MTHAPLAPIAAVSGYVTLLALQSVTPSAGPALTIPVALLAIGVTTGLALRSEKNRKREAYAKAEKEQAVINATVQAAFTASAKEHQETRRIVRDSVEALCGRFDAHVEDDKRQFTAMDGKLDETIQGVTAMVEVFGGHTQRLIDAQRTVKALPAPKRKRK